MTRLPDDADLDFPTISPEERKLLDELRDAAPTKPSWYSDSEWEDHLLELDRAKRAKAAKAKAKQGKRDNGAEPHEPGPRPETPPAKTLAEVREVFQRWLGKDYDTSILDAVLAVAAAEKLPGDPPWLMIISGPGNAKTETAQSVSAVPGSAVVSTITSEGALLSATPQKTRSKNATGGLLRKMGKRGLLVIKDFTSILSAGRELRTAMLAALREVHDGRWVRNVGTDGGQTLVWEGRLVVIGACTTAWDQAHGVISIMGDRFVLVRSDSYAGRLAAGALAISNTGREIAMRQEMANAVAGLVATVVDRDYPLTKDDTTRILNAADLVTLIRTGVELDYRGDVVDAHAPEMPTRFAKQLTQIMRGALAIGMDQTAALALALRCARDSAPELRLALLKDLAANGESRVIEIRRRQQKPRATVDRALQALHYLRLLVCREEEEDRGGKKVLVRYYTLAPKIDITVLDSAAAAASPEGGPAIPEMSGGYKASPASSSSFPSLTSQTILTDFSGIAGDPPGGALQAKAATVSAPRHGRGAREPASSIKSTAEARTPPEIIVPAARWKGVAFVLAPTRDLFTLEWAGPSDPLINEAIRGNYEAILAWLIREAEGLRPDPP
jgi:hypothetical protein